MEIFQWELSCSMRTDGQTQDIHDEADILFLQFANASKNYKEGGVGVGG